MAVDPGMRCVALSAYEGVLKIIPIKADGKLGTAFDLRCPIQVLDICFINDDMAPRLALLTRTHDGNQLHLYTVDLGAKELTSKATPLRGLEPEASILVPVQGGPGGFLVAGETQIIYATPELRRGPACDVQWRTFGAVGGIDPDGSRYLLGDQSGDLHLLVLEQGDGVVKGLKMTLLGQTSIASSLTYVDEGVVFLGSSFGDSQLLRLSTEALHDGSYFEELDVYTNIAPIMDMCMVDLAKQGQCQVVTCSGNMGDGSLRIIQNGIGVIEMAAIEMPGVQSISPLRDAEGHVGMLCISFAAQTAFLRVSGEELEGTALPGAAADAAT
eukprot:UC1_evm1s507